MRLVTIFQEIIEISAKEDVSNAAFFLVMLFMVIPQMIKRGV